MTVTSLPYFERERERSVLFTERRTGAVNGSRLLWRHPWPFFFFSLPPKSVIQVRSNKRIKCCTTGERKSGSVGITDLMRFIFCEHRINYLPECGNMWSGRYVPTFQNSLTPPLSTLLTSLQTEDQCSTKTLSSIKWLPFTAYVHQVTQLLFSQFS